MSKNVYQMIASISGELAKQGISKDRKNTQGSGYSFRGIDDVYNALAPLLSKEGLVILPRCISRSCEERQSKSGGVLFYTTVQMEFDFVSSQDGSKHTVATIGEAMDSGDKSTNKAMSAAYKYAAFQTFCIPTEGDNDADSNTHEVLQKAVDNVAKVIGIEPPNNKTCWEFAKDYKVNQEEYKRICNEAGITTDKSTHTQDRWNLVWAKLCERSNKK